MKFEDLNFVQFENPTFMEFENASIVEFDEWNRMDVIVVYTIMNNLFPTLYISLFPFTHFLLSLSLYFYFPPSLILQQALHRISLKKFYELSYYWNL